MVSMDWWFFVRGEKQARSSDQGRLSHREGLRALTKQLQFRRARLQEFWDMLILFARYTNETTATAGTVEDHWRLKHALAGVPALTKQWELLNKSPVKTIKPQDFSSFILSKLNRRQA
eukprot:4543260-Amphidinium_carterae.3